MNEVLYQGKCEGGDQDNVKVFFVDCENAEAKNIEEILEIPEDFLDLPFKLTVEEGKLGLFAFKLTKEEDMLNQLGEKY